MWGEKMVRNLSLKVEVFLRISQDSLSMIWSLGLCIEVVSVSKCFRTPFLKNAPVLNGKAFVNISLL